MSVLHGSRSCPSYGGRVDVSRSRSIPARRADVASPCRSAAIAALGSLTRWIRDLRSPSPERVPTPRTPCARPSRWGLGDFVWIYVAGIVALGRRRVDRLRDHRRHVRPHRRASPPPCRRSGSSARGSAASCYVAAHQGPVGSRTTSASTLELRDWWAPFAGLGLFLVGTALIAAARQHRRTRTSRSSTTSTTRAAPSSRCSRSSPRSSRPSARSCCSAGCCCGRCGGACRPTAAVIVQALAFALAHPMLSPTLGDLAVVPALFLLGAVSGHRRRATGRSLGVDPDAHRLQPRDDALGPLSGDLPAGRDGRRVANVTDRSASVRGVGCRPTPPALCQGGTECWSAQDVRKRCSSRSACGSRARDRVPPLFEVRGEHVAGRRGRPVAGRGARARPGRPLSAVSGRTDGMG